MWSFCAERKDKKIKELLDEAVDADMGAVGEWMEHKKWAAQNGPA